ncbi:putative secreted lipase [Paramyrothecium foliicola]|nr:putative secreted lipase [Paramyrothecium foliicola]
MKAVQILQALGLVTSALALPAPDATLEDRAAKVTVALPAGTVIGSSALSIESFRGIPYADPPVGSLRFKPPRRLSKALGTFDATGIAASCPQLFISSATRGLLGGILKELLDLPFLDAVSGQEDCLSISVQRPAGTKPGDKLPVLFWIFGGGFQLGSSNMYDGSSLLAAGVQQKQPFIFVAVNHRTGAFGYLPGADILKEGSSNAGLLDQRMGLEWVADNIAAFGGDPDKVTIWGESAGAISVLDQMLLYGGDAKYKGKPLFRGAIMNSGSIVPAEPIDCPKGELIYEQVVREAGCQGSQDALACLRNVDYETMLDAANSVPGILSFNSVALSYLPRPDGKVLPASPDVLVASGQYYPVPMIIGDQEDEGTLFALFQPNLTTTSEMVDYLGGLFFQSAPKSQLTDLVSSYSPILTAGSPFRTGILNEWYPGFKRLAAILGDLVFTLTRRLFLESTTKAYPDVPSWSYLASYNYGTPIMGTFHGSDLLQVFYGILPNNAARSCRTYYFNFLYNLDPNVGVGGYPKWPKWAEKKELLWFETANKNSYLPDNFRSKSYELIKTYVSSLYV